MHLLICTRTDAFMVNDRCGTLLESVRRFFKVLSREYPETAFENCEWRSSLADWPEVDAFVGIPRGSEPKIAAAVEVFVHYVLETARIKKRFRQGSEPVELAIASRKGQAGRLLLTPQKTLLFDDQEILAFLRADSLFPLCESIESLDRRKFSGLCCRVGAPTKGDSR
jgi:hypothetical protein